MAKTTPKAKNSGFMKPMQPSEHLAKIVGTDPLPRSEVTKKIWAHIKKHNLQNPKNKREILADDKLQPNFWQPEIGHVSDDQGGQQAFEIRDWRVTALMNRYAEAPRAVGIPR